MQILSVAEVQLPIIGVLIALVLMIMEQEASTGTETTGPEATDREMAGLKTTGP